MKATAKNIKVAFGSVPKDGGTFTFYRNLRPVLVTQGIDLHCVSVGQREAGITESAYVDEGCVLLAPDTNNIKKQALIFAEWCVEEKIDIVMAINSVAILSSLLYLPKQIRVISRCANAFDEGYRVTMSGRERLMRIVALTPRLRDDLVKSYGADPEMIDLIPNGIDPRPFRPDVGNGAEEKPLSTNNDYSQTSRTIQLGFLGRLEHNQKGVLYLPEIVRELKKLNIPFHLQIAGKGKHRSELEKGLQPFIDSGEVELIGALTKDEVPGFLNGTDVYLFTSHFEGCPNALLEAMMAGCAPVAFLIEGITDFVLDHGRTGFVAPMGDCAAFAGRVAELLSDSELLQRMQRSTVADAHQRFVPEVAAAEYARVFQDVMAAPLPNYKPLPWSKFKIDAAYRRGWKALVPQSLKEFAKKLRG